LVAAIIAVTIGVGLLVSLSQWYTKDSELLSDGSRAVGTVVRKYSVEHEDSSGSGGSTLHVAYTFSSAMGEQMEGHGSIGSQLWHQMEVGSPIEIVYDPVDPSHNLPVATERPGMWMIYLAPIFSTVGAFLLAYLVLLLVIWFVSKLIPRGR
jgi:hypothetical protein